MNISLNWLKEYVSIDPSLSPEKIGEILTAIGLEVEGLEKVSNIKGELKGIVVGEVLECFKHPGADRLSVTKVNLGDAEPKQIVCGAPNVAAGQKVLVATVGTQLYSPEGESFEIRKSKIRGEISEGMICAEDELGLGASHDGIMVLDPAIEPGVKADTLYEIKTDHIYDIGLTPNRSDATSHLGVAKDLAAYLKIHHDTGQDVKIPDVSDFAIDTNDMAVEVVVEDHEACPRYTGVSISGVEIKESPQWLKEKLEGIGVRSISNMVDITNFILHELGQPLHAFDLDKITNRKIIVKQLAEGSPFQSLDEKERKLSAEDLMICDGASKPMCIGGVFGGLNSGVTDNTKNIFLEAAHFNAKSIRRSSTRHLLRTDAAKVFEKGSDPNVCVYGLKRAALMIKELCGGSIASEIVDVYPNKIAANEIPIRYDFIRKHTGVDFKVEEIKNILAALKIDIKEENETGCTVVIPTDKSEVLREVDVIEEILRIYGLDNVPFKEKLEYKVSYAEGVSPIQLREKISEMLSSRGFNEMISLSMQASNYYKDLLPDLHKKIVEVNNTSNIDLDGMRPTMLFSGLEAIKRNKNRQNKELACYEFGRIYQKKTESIESIKTGIIEEERLALFFYGNKAGLNWLSGKNASQDFYTMKGHVDALLSKIGAQQCKLKQLGDDPVFEYGINYFKGKQLLGSIGKVKPNICKQMEIKEEVFYADFELAALLKIYSGINIEAEVLSKFPSVKRDLALVIDEAISFKEIIQLVKTQGDKRIKNVSLFDVFRSDEKLGANKKSYAISFQIEDKLKTLTDKEIDEVFDGLISIFKTKLNAEIRT